MVCQQHSTWLFSATIIFSSRLLKKSLIKNWSFESSSQCKSLDGFELLFIWNHFGCKIWLPSIQNHVVIVSMLLRVAIWNGCAFRLELEQAVPDTLYVTLTPTDSSSNEIRVSGLHRIWFSRLFLCYYFYFYAETNECSQDWAKQWTLLWAVTCSHEIHRNLNPISNEKKNLSLRPKHWNLFGPRIKSVCKSAHFFLQWASRGLQRPPTIRKHCVLVCVICVCPSDPPKLCRRAAPRAWPLICSQNLRLPSGISFGSDC